MIFKIGNTTETILETESQWSCRISPPTPAFHLANAVNGLLHTLFQGDISHSQNNAAEGRCNKRNVVHRNLVELYALLFRGRVVDRLEDGNQLVMDERACTDDEAAVCCSW